MLDRSSYIIYAIQISHKYLQFYKEYESKTID